MMHPVATTDTAPTTDGELPSQAVVPVSGIDVEQLDLSTRQAAAYLFPKERGLLLLTLLFLQAEIQTLEIDGSGQVDVAIIRLQSIEVFARAHPGWSKDTMLRYITILEALQILQRHRHAEYTEIHVPLIVWQPSEAALAALDDLLIEDAARAKLQQLASGVKARFLLLYGSPNSWLSLFDDLDGTLTDIQAVLNNRPGRTKRQLLQLRVTNLKARLGVAAKRGDFHCGQCPHSGQESTQKGDFYSGQGAHNGQDDAQKGDFRTGSSRVNGACTAQRGDFQNSVGASYSSHVAQEGDFQPGPQSTNGHKFTQKGDFQGSVSTHLTQKGDFQNQSAVVSTQKGDFQGSAPAASFNDNVITISNDSTLMDDVSDNDAAATVRAQDHYSSGEAAKVGRQLALFLEKTPENTGGFVNKCKQCSRTVIRAAVIDVLVHAAFPQVDPADERGRPKNRASWFHDACKKYGKPGTRIPGFIEKWHKTDLAWDEIERQLNEAALRYKRYMISDSSTADLVRQWLRGEIEQQALDDALQTSALSQEKSPQRAPQSLTSVTSATNGTPLVVRAPHASAAAEKTWMDEDEAEALAEEILRDASQFGVSKAIAKQEHGVYVVALTWLGSTFPMKTPQQWRAHLESVRPEFERRMKQKGESNGTTR
jgi:hypothetical protein